MRSMTKHGGFVTALLTAVLLLGGCSDDEPEAAPLPIRSPLPTPPSRSPDPGETVREVKTPQEFIRLLNEIETETINTGDTEEYRAITQGCEPCKKTADRIEGFYAKGGYAKTKGSRIV
jgi:hypothetical protein